VANPAWFRGVSFCTIDFPMFHSVFFPPPQKKRHVGFPPVRLQEGPVENVAIICCCVASSLSPEDLGVRVYVRVCALHCGPKQDLFRGSDETQLITDASGKW
jgi:hypothetical protein